MLEQDLGITLPTKLVHIQTVDAGDAFAVARPLLHRRVEMNGIDHAAGAGQAEGEFKVAFANDAVVEHLELTIKARRRKILSPRKGVIKQLGIGQGDLVVRPAAMAWPPNLLSMPG